tara:strand:+ start:230 stop:1186 length:957 start_codon:yes stop_codon:yes gene_type:complete
MDDLKSSQLNEHKEAVKSWWNSEHTKQKWHGQTYKQSFETHLHYWVRQEKTLKLLDELHLPEGSKILELGYGGGELAGKILDRKFKYFGIDISNHLLENANKNYSDSIKNNQAYFFQGSLEEKFDFQDNMFDVVIICGAIHYAGKLSENFLEVKRVLKPNGYYIIGQGNMYTMNDLINFRKLIKCIIWFFTKEKYMHSYSLAFKDMIFETNLKKYFLRYENSKFFKSKFMNKYSNSWKYKIQKRMFSYKTLKGTIESNKFEVIKFYGGPFLYSSSENRSFLKNFFNNIFQYLLDKKVFIFLIRMSDNFIFLSKPNKND